MNTSQHERRGTSVMSSSLPTASWINPISTIKPLISSEIETEDEPKEDPSKITAYERVRIRSRSWGQDSLKEESSVIAWKISNRNEKARFVMLESGTSLFLGVTKSTLRSVDPSRDWTRISITSLVHEIIQGRRDDQNFTENSWTNRKPTEASVRELTGTDGSKYTVWRVVLGGVRM